MEIHTKNIAKSMETIPQDKLAQLDLKLRVLPNFGLLNLVF
jgi:hypothetical protein